MRRNPPCSVSASYSSSASTKASLGEAPSAVKVAHRPCSGLMSKTTLALEVILTSSTVKNDVAGATGYTGRHVIQVYGHPPTGPWVAPVG